jgi:raffinose/stachyose/melibiose transport system substrate-binding protein
LSQTFIEEEKKQMKKPASIFSILILVSLILAACSVQATETPAAETAAPEVETTSPPAAQSGEKVTLVVWDQFTREVESEVIETLNQEFEEAHPGVQIERSSKVLDDLKATVKLALSESDGPDVSQVNQGRSDMGALVQAGLLLPLNDYASEFNWDERVSPSISSRNSFTEDGKTFGEGNLYGVSPTAEVVGVYYNKGMFEENGWELPTTFDEFTQLVADIKAAGVTPLVFGNLDGWPGIHEFSSVQHILTDPEPINNFVYGTGDASFDTPENQEAASIMQEWVDASYFTDGFSGIGYDDSWKLFKAGQGAMMITGSWLSGELVNDTDQQFGFFLMPQETADEAQFAIGGVGIPYSIRATTEHTNLAAEYLDWMISPRAAQLWAEASIVPAMPLPEDAQLEEGTLFADTVAAWDRINQDNGVGHYIDWASPTIYDTLAAELQRLYAKETDPAAFTEAVQADYGAFLETLKEE